MENKTGRPALPAGRYFKYAIGEIILVVLGILIALWINQKYNYSQERQDEINVLQEIRTNLDSDLIEITADITYMDSINISYNFVSKYLIENELPSNEFGAEALKLRITPHFNPNLSGYNLLVSKGIEIIQNDELRKVISYHFESTYSYYKAYEKERIDFRIHQMDPVFMKYFTHIQNNSISFLGEYRITNEDFTTIKSSHSNFNKFLSSIKRENDLVQNRANRLQKSILDLSEMVDAELEKRD
jgi:hypothetical protein